MTVQADDAGQKTSLAFSVSKCVELLQLLHAADCFPRGGLYTGFYALAAAIRYERVWMHIMSTGESCIPPLDVAYAWFVDRQDPGGYARALADRGVGRIHPSPDLAFRFGPRYPDRVAWCAAAGEHHAAWPPPAPGSRAISLDDYQLGSASDLAACMGRFSRMLHSWLRPHFLDPDFLQRALARYIRFLQLHADQPDVTLVPTADIALVWHTHLGMSEDYAEACRKLFGSEREPWGPDYLHVADPSKLEEEYGKTTKLYEQTYGEPYDGPDTAWLADTVPYPLATVANPLAFALRVFDGNPQQASQQAAIALACKASELAVPPPGSPVVRSGAHALYSAWLAARRAEAAYERASSGWRRLAGRGSALSSSIQHALVSLVSVSYFLELPDTDTHPYIRSIELRKGLWKGAQNVQAGEPAVAHAPLPFAPTDPAMYLSPPEAALLVGLDGFLGAGAATPPAMAKSKSTKTAGPAALWCALGEKDLGGQAPPLLTEMWVAANGVGVGRMQSQYIDGKDVEIPTIGCTIYGSSDYYDAATIKMSGVQGEVRATARSRQLAAAAAATHKVTAQEAAAPPGASDTGREYMANGVLYRGRQDDGSASGSASSSGRRRRWNLGPYSSTRPYSHYAPPIAFWGYGEMGGGGCGGGGGGCGGGS